MGPDTFGCVPAPAAIEVCGVDSVLFSDFVEERFLGLYAVPLKTIRLLI